MKVNKCCKTCTYSYNDFCTNNFSVSEVGFMDKITDPHSFRYCWSISIPTVISLINRLTRFERKLITKASHLSANELIVRIENGYWAPKNKLFHSLNNYLLRRKGMDKIKIIS